MENNKEKMMKDSFAKINISTTSAQILQAYEKEKVSTMNQPQVSKKKNPFRLVMVSLSASVLLAASAVGIYFIVKGSTPYSPVIIKKNEQAAFELFTGASLLNEQLNSKKALAKHNPFLSENDDDDDEHNSGRLTETEFASMVDVYHNNYQTYYSLIENGVEIKNTIEEGTFAGKSETFTYKMTINDDYYFYYSFDFDQSDDDELESNYTGELHLNNEDIFPVSFQIENNTNTQKREIEMEITYSLNSILKIEFGQTANRSSYEYTYFENDEEVKAIEIEIKEKSQSRKVEIEIKEVDHEYSFEVKKVDDQHYQIAYEDGTLNASGTILMIISGTTITYQEKQLSYQIVKQIQ